MEYLNLTATITSAAPCGAGVSLVVFCPEAAALAEAGQFVHIKIGGFFLRRPISICEILGDSLRLVFEPRGAGTRALAEFKAGDSLDILAPLGNGFPAVGEGERVFLVGGGIGVPPLFEVAKRTNATAFLGFRDTSRVILREDFEKHCKAFVSLEPELVSAPLSRELEREKPDYIFACGPLPMLRAAAELAKAHGVECYLSLEERMACGVGACLVCACETTLGMRHVCKDGPVFNANIIFP